MSQEAFLSSLQRAGAPEVLSIRVLPVEGVFNVVFAAELTPKEGQRLRAAGFRFMRSAFSAHLYQMRQAS